MGPRAKLHTVTDGRSGLAELARGVHDQQWARETETFLSMGWEVFGVATNRKSAQEAFLSNLPMNSARSQLSSHGVDFAESIFLLARLAESIFRDVSALKF